MKVNVTAKDIQRGKRDDPRQCPVARALHRIKGFSRNIHVESTTIYQSKSVAGVTDFTAEFRLPALATKFIRRFDRRQPVKPFTFELRLK